MDYTQFLTIMAALIGSSAFLWIVAKELLDDIKIQQARSDQLYTMFIDLLKEEKGK